MEGGKGAGEHRHGAVALRWGREKPGLGRRKKDKKILDLVAAGLRDAWGVG